MPELAELMNDLPATLGGNGADIQPTDENEEELDDENEDDTSTNTDTDTDEDSEEEDGDTDGDSATVTDEDEDDDDFIIALGDDEDEEEKTPPAKVETPAGAPKLDNEGAFILAGLPKIKTNVILQGADGKDVTKEVEVYGWGQLRAIPGLKGFASELDQVDFLTAAQNNENRAKELQTEFRTKKMEADTQAYTMKENRAIAMHLKSLRQEGLFPKFKGVPGSKEFNESAGAKMFDEVIAFMNKENDEGGQAANKGEQFTHISFRQAYRMLHPEVFNEKAKAEKKQKERDAARRVKSSGGTRPSNNVKTSRVSNINDLASEFADFVGRGNA